MTVVLIALVVFFLLLKTTPGSREYFSPTPTPSPEGSALVPGAFEERDINPEMVAPKLEIPVGGPPPGPKTMEIPFVRNTEPASYEALGKVFYTPYETNMTLMNVDGTQSDIHKLYEPQRTHGQRPYADTHHQDTRPPGYDQHHQFDFMDRSHDPQNLRAYNDSNIGPTNPRKSVTRSEAPYTGVPKYP
jgi:hypothetical protein